MPLTHRQTIDNLTQDINRVKLSILRKRAELNNFGTPTDYLKMAEKGRLKEAVEVELPLLLKRYEDTLSDYIKPKK